MRIGVMLLIFWTLPALGQSILLSHVPNRPKKAVASGISFVEFRDASMKNVLRLIKIKGNLKTSQAVDLSSGVNLRLVNTNWLQLQKAVLSEALENSLETR